MKTDMTSTPLDQLSPEKLRELGLDKAMIYVAPLKGMLELSLLEYCTEIVHVGHDNEATPTLISDWMGIQEESISHGLVFTHPNPPPQFKKPDLGLKNLVEDLEKNHRIVTPKELQKEIDKRKEQNKSLYGPRFEEVWKEIHGEEQE
jgi:hypothetical protein